MNGPQPVESLEQNEFARRAARASVAGHDPWWAGATERAEDPGTAGALSGTRFGSRQGRGELQPERSQLHPRWLVAGAVEASQPTAQDSGTGLGDAPSGDGSAGEASLKHKEAVVATAPATEAAAGSAPQESLRKEPKQVELLQQREVGRRGALMGVCRRRLWWARMGQWREDRTTPSGPRSRSGSRRRPSVAKPPRRRLDPGVLAGIAQASRRREGERGQQARREREDAVRDRLAIFSETAHSQGIAYEQLAHELDVPVRTLSYWRQVRTNPQRVFGQARASPAGDRAPDPPAGAGPAQRHGPADRRADVAARVSSGGSP